MDFFNADDRAAARRFRFEAHTNVSNVIVQLSPRLPTRPVRVGVYWADGSPVTKDARAFADYQGHRAAFEASKSSNIVELTLIEGLEYSVSADWFSLAGEPVHYMTSDHVKLSAGQGPATIDIRLRSTKP